MIVDALTYPVRGSGWMMILLGAILGVIFDVATIAPLFGLAVMVFAGGYFCAFYFDIIGSTMCGHDDMPDWPGFADFLEEIVTPLLTLIGLVLLSFSPLIAMVFLDEDYGLEPWFDAAFYAAIAIGCCYFPMAIIANQSLGTFASALPHVVLPAIFKALPSYLVAVVALIVVYLTVAVANDYAVTIPYVGWFVAWAVALYGLMFQARLIGLIYREKQDVLGFP